MQCMNWRREHCDALREYHTRGMSYGEIAQAINMKFKTDYSRSATIGRARRMGLTDPDRPKPGTLEVFLRSPMNEWGGVFEALAMSGVGFLLAGTVRRTARH